MKEEFRLPRRQMLKSRLATQALFANGKSMLAFPLRAVWLTYPSDESATSFQLLVSVPRRNFKRAVDRNLIKRRLREAFRLNMNALRGLLERQGLCMHLAFIYSASEMSDWEAIAAGVKKLLGQLERQMAKIH